jgi:hypothetical protein
MRDEERMYVLNAKNGHRCLRSLPRYSLIISLSAFQPENVLFLQCFCWVATSGIKIIVRTCVCNTMYLQHHVFGRLHRRRGCSHRRSYQLRSSRGMSCCTQVGPCWSQFLIKSIIHFAWQAIANGKWKMENRPKKRKP